MNSSSTLSVDGILFTVLTQQIGEGFRTTISTEQTTGVSLLSQTLAMETKHWADDLFENELTLQWPIHCFEREPGTIALEALQFQPTPTQLENLIERLKAVEAPASDQRSVLNTMAARSAAAAAPIPTSTPAAEEGNTLALAISGDGSP